MISEQAQKKRDELAKEFCKHWSVEVYHPNDLTLFYEKGFDAGYQFAKSEAAAEIEDLKKHYRSSQNVSQDLHYKCDDRAKQIRQLEAIIAKLEDGLKTIGHGEFISLLNCAQRARLTLTSVQAMKEKLK